MTALFGQAAQTIDLAPLRDFKAQGGKLIGTTCTFLPVEVFHAAGLLPIRLRGIGAESLNIADAYYGPFVCTFPKALLQQVGTRHYDFLDGAVVTGGCDGMRRLVECWRKMGQDIPGVRPPWFYYFDVPHKPDGVALAWYRERVRKLIQEVQTAFGVRIDAAALGRAIQLQNRIRRKIWELGELRTRTPAPLSGREAFEALIARNVLPPELYLEELQHLIDAVRARPVPSSDHRRRLFVTGSICDDLSLVRQIEAAGAVVVGETVCYGLRNSCEQVDESGDPVAALSDHYLSGSVCPRMFGYYAQRRAAIIERIRQTGAQGVIMQNIRFCDLHGSENGLLERDLEKLKIPALRIEKEYGALTETGRLHMRVEAFLEQLEK
jgi:benzoyl-CoA reductase/2-hydroxyglutaryl-CoA dehydratase subunit BcrC/BadD/HgdB